MGPGEGGRREGNEEEGKEEGEKGGLDQKEGGDGILKKRRRKSRKVRGQGRRRGSGNEEKGRLTVGPW